MSLLQKSNKKVSSRRQINIREVKDGVLVLPDNQYRVILHVSSINFELKSEAEQDAIIETYQSVLNSIDFPLQILVRVRELDMDSYLETYSAKAKQEKQKVYREQIKYYTQFVGKLVKSNKILSRNFYVIVPYDNKDGSDFALVQEQLRLRQDIVGKGFGRLGMRTRQSSSLEALDMFYSFYNPDQAKQQPISDSTLRLLQEAAL